MINRLILFIFVLITIQDTYGQSGLVTIEIHPDSLRTSSIVTFHCIISNPTNKNYKYFGYVSDWENRIYPECWEIIIKKDTSSYLDCSWQYKLLTRIQSGDIKLLKHSSNKFDFTLNFSKVCKWSDLSKMVYPDKTREDIQEAIKNYKNESYGDYSIMIRYAKEFYDPKNPIALESNWVTIDYKK